MSSPSDKSVLLEAVRETGFRDQIVTVTHRDLQFPSKRSMSLDAFKAEFREMRDLQAGYGVKLKGTWAVVGEPYLIIHDDREGNGGRRVSKFGPRLAGDLRHGHHVNPVEVRRLAKTHTTLQISQSLGVDVATIRYHLKKSGIKAKIGRVATAITGQRRSFIREHAGTCTVAKIADQLGVTPNAVKRHLLHMGLKAKPGKRGRPFRILKDHEA